MLADERGPSYQTAEPSHAHGRRRAFALPSYNLRNGRGDDLPRPPRTVWIVVSSSNQRARARRGALVVDPGEPDNPIDLYVTCQCTACSHLALAQLALLSHSWYQTKQLRRAFWFAFARKVEFLHETCHKSKWAVRLLHSNLAPPPQFPTLAHNSLSLLIACFACLSAAAANSALHTHAMIAPVNGQQKALRVVLDSPCTCTSIVDTQRGCHL